MSEEAVPQQTPQPARRRGQAKPLVFAARPGLSTDFSDIREAAAEQKPRLTLDESLGVRWIKPRGRLVGVRYGTLRQRRAMEKHMEMLQEEADDPDVQYTRGIEVFQPLLCLPDTSDPSGVRTMTIEEIEDRLDLVDLQPIAELAFPAASPLQAAREAGADPNA